MKNRVKLHSEERALLVAIDQNARGSFESLGKAAGLSKQTARNLFQRLTTAGVIKGTTSVIDISRLGHSGFAVFAQIEGQPDAQIEKVIEFLNGKRNVYWVAPLGGKYYLVFSAHCSSINEFATFYDDVQSRFSTTLRNCNVSIRLEVTQLPRRYLGVLAKKGEGITFGRANEVIELDELDRAIVNYLAADSRTNISDIANALDVPRTTVGKRIEKLERKRVIVGHAALIHANAYDYQLYHILIKTKSRDKKFVESFRTFVKGHPNIVTYARTLGSWDIELTCEMESATELQKLIMTLRTRFKAEIDQIESLILFSHFEKYRFTV